MIFLNYNDKELLSLDNLRRVGKFVSPTWGGRFWNQKIVGYDYYLILRYAKEGRWDESYQIEVPDQATLDALYTTVLGLLEQDAKL